MMWTLASGVVNGGGGDVTSNRAVASLTVQGGQEFHFPHFFLKFQSICLLFLKLIFFLILALRMGDFREGPVYATDQ